MDFSNSTEEILDYIDQKLSEGNIFASVKQLLAELNNAEKEQLNIRSTEEFSKVQTFLEKVKITAEKSQCSQLNTLLCNKNN